MNKIRKHIDIIREKAKQYRDNQTKDFEKKRKRKVNEKEYVELFIKNAKSKYKYIKQGDVDPNELIIHVTLPDDSDLSKLNIALHFDQYDDIKTVIVTDKSFYNGMFYKEVIKTERYKEAWQILKQKYKSCDWINKYIYFLLHAPPIIPLILY
jgi:hypothetical protein